MKCCEKKTIILLGEKWKLTNLVERQVNDPFAITCPNGKNDNDFFKKTQCWVGSKSTCVLYISLS